MTSDWSDRDLRFIKRNLSEYEKRSLTHTGGRALVFPGSPKTEIEELVAVGFDVEKIHGVEHDAQAADELYEYYMDTAHIHWIEAEEFMMRATLPFSYVHLDFCNYFERIALNTLELALTKLTPSARLRMSLYRSRKGENQWAFEELLKDKVLRPFAQLAGLSDTAFAASEDVTQSVIAVILCVATFGVKPLEFADAVVAGEMHDLPKLGGHYRIASFRRFEYSEPHSPHAMSSFWVDLMPLPHTSITSNDTWRTQEVAQVLGALDTPATPYANPSMFS